MDNPFDAIMAELHQLRTDMASIKRQLTTPAVQVEQERYIGTKEAAALLGRKPKWVRDNLQRIPHSKQRGRQLAFSTLELRAWMEQQYEEGRVPTVAEAAAKAMRPATRPHKHTRTAHAHA